MRWVSLRSTHPTALGFSNHHEGPSAAKPPPKQQSLFHHRGTEFAEFGVFFNQNSLLHALRGSTGSPRPEPVEGRASALKIVADQPGADPRGDLFRLPPF